MNILKNIFFCIGKLCSYLVPFQTPLMWRAIHSHLYTGFVSRRFQAFGKGSLIGTPVGTIRGAEHIRIGENTEIAQGILLTTWPRELCTNPCIEIGNNCHIGKHSHISAAKSIHIGDNLLTGPNVLIVDNSHGGWGKDILGMPPSTRPLTSKGPIHIGNNVWLGTNVCIMSGVSIGNGAIVAANSIVTHNVPPYTLVAGVPAKIIRKLDVATNIVQDTQ